MSSKFCTLNGAQRRRWNVKHSPELIKLSLDRWINDFMIRSLNINLSYHPTNNSLVLLFHRRLKKVISLLFLKFQIMEFCYEKRKIQHMSIVTCDAENFDEKSFLSFVLTGGCLMFIENILKYKYFMVEGTRKSENHVPILFLKKKIRNPRKKLAHKFINEFDNVHRHGTTAKKWEELGRITEWIIIHVRYKNKFILTVN